MIGPIASGLAGWLAGAAGNWAADRLPEIGQGRAVAERSAGFPAENPVETAPDEGPPRAGAPREVRAAAFRNHSWPRPVRAVRDLPHVFTLPWYFFRLGICPHCGERRPLRAALLEAAAIGAFLLAWWRLGADPFHTAVVCLYGAFLLTVLVIDLERRRVLNVMVAPAAVIALLVSLLPGSPTPWQALGGGAIGFGIFALITLIGRGKMGAGDVKLMGVIGLMTGYPAILSALVLGIILGGVAALILLITRRAGRKSTMAYAPYLAVAALVTLIWTR